VSFGSTVLIPSIPVDQYQSDASDDDDSLNPDDLFASDETDEGSITVDELVQASEYVRSEEITDIWRTPSAVNLTPPCLFAYCLSTDVSALVRQSFCAMNDPGGEDEYILRRIPNKICKKLSSAKLGNRSYPFLDFQDSTDVTYSQSESESGTFACDGDGDDELILRKLDASFSSSRVNELLGSRFVSKLASALRTGENVSDLTLDALNSDDGIMAVAPSQQGPRESPGPPATDDATAKPSFRVAPKV
jgi:hypothetical protein